MEFQYSLKQIMEITGVTKRTLHYYDEIGLLKVQKNNHNYRIYTQNDLVRLQKILLLKSLDLSMKEINQVIDYNDDNLKLVLEKQKEHLNKKISQLERTKSAIEKYINNVPIVDIEELNHVPYKQYQNEAKIKYGDNEIYKTFTNKNKDELFSNKENLERLDQIFQKFNHLSKEKVDVEEAYDVVYEWKEMMKHYSDFDDELLCLIADTYDKDGRFKNYFKKFDNPYLTRFISEAVNYHLSQVQS